ncbi:ATP-grasp domain-containing protein [Cruoricaptor ignavus]|uniref:ATP-grasp domain-containing protein n=1 Tax=Cruoricaptor ignavus TaxID=1118202 RepID=A0A1M6CCL7_9FLAO|nr:ATP-grasp domain-containing protein [Cruoricaptor ignavus]SHI58795.1 ATP-grasp domain-containing protein [Cruoricaptor ignavus]
METKTIVCLACSFKGSDFITEFAKNGDRILLITSAHLREKPWPWHAIADVFYMEETEPWKWNLQHLVEGFAHLLRREKVEAIIALDDYDVEKAAKLREVFRISGMGQSTHRNFRDKLAMRMKALDEGIPVPEFTAVFNDDAVNDFAEKIPAPWVLKPRSEASAMGIRKIHSKEELWQAINELGNQRHLFLLEAFKPGDVFHTDSLVYKNRVAFLCASQYGEPPMQVSHNGGIFQTRTLDKKTDEYKALEKLNAKVLKAFGLKHGAAHTEFIRNKENGEWYFLETSSRVGGAHIADMVEAATEVNIWAEWARIEQAVLHGERYKLKKPKPKPAGLTVALSSQQKQDYSRFSQDNILKTIELDYHFVIVHQAANDEDLAKSMDDAAAKISQSTLSVMPAKTGGRT